MDLDATNDKCWTDEGKPAIDVLAVKFPNVQRKLVDKVASDLTREEVGKRQAALLAAQAQ
jgi:hypothetical protein